MSKGLRALERLKPLIEANFKHWKQDVGYIENELKEYDMEHTLRIRLENINYELVREKQELEKAFVALSKDDEKAKKLLSLEIEKNRALEIIKNKGIDILALQHYKNASQYNFSLRGKFSQLTEKEFNLLKEVLL